ncbi:MAG TPA: DNA methyltransferase [Polyangiaceae bacterium]|nr:DNA methyltransferase [Polyangiaceae bacterium]
MSPPPKASKARSASKGKRPRTERPLLRRDRRALAKQRAEEKALQGPPPERRERRALSHVGGRIEVWGDEGLAAALAPALDVSDDDESTRAHVHGFHSYAARLHPLTARRLVESLSEPRGTVLDAFMGSGTVLVEARLLGRHGVGTDLNPLSLELAHLKTRGSSERERRELVEAATRVAEYADERRIAKAGPTVRYGREDLELFDVHMLLELDGIRHGISLEPPGFAREALKLVLSSILVKVSKRPGDTTERLAPRRLATGFAIKLFANKAAELAERLGEFAALLPRAAPECDLAVDDARRLSTVRSGSVDLVVSSPPYPGVYDYAHHHAARLRWLGLDTESFERGEIGARRKLRGSDRDELISRWQDDFAKTLTALGRVLRSDACAVLVMADSVVQRRPLYADDVLEYLAPRAGLAVAAIASQKRPHFHEPSRDAFVERPRREHLVALVKQRDTKAKR